MKTSFFIATLLFIAFISANSHSLKSRDQLLDTHERRFHHRNIFSPASKTIFLADLPSNDQELQHVFHDQYLSNTLEATVTDHQGHLTYDDKDSQSFENVNGNIVADHEHTHYP